MQGSDQLADFTTDRRVLVLSCVAVVIGGAGAAVAYGLLWLINLITNLSFLHRLSAAAASPDAAPRSVLTVAVPVLGGLAVGLMARYGSDKIRGHGIPEALEAILIGRSRIDPKVAVLKPLSSAVSIGTGGPFGAEGPIIMTGGAVGSIVAQFLHLSSAERKTLLVAGAAAGMAAVFAAPVAASLLAVELLLFEWKPRSFIPVAFAAVTAAVARVPLLGAGPLFAMPGHAALGSHVVGYALLVGIVGGLASGVLTNLVYAFEDAFQKVPIHWMWWPAIGGLFIGIGGLVDPRVLGVGYGTIGALLSGRVVGMALLGLLAAKALVWSISLGSGTSGGVLAPLLMMGGALGAFGARWIPAGSPGIWAAIGMAAVMGGTMRSPFTAIVFALELTHDVSLLPGLLMACTAAEAVTVLLLRRSILTEKVARRGHHLIREYVADPFEVHRVGAIMVQPPPTVPARITIQELASRLAHGDRRLTRRQAAVVVDEAGRAVGVITQGDVLRALEQPDGGSMQVGDAASGDLVVAYADEVVRHAVVRMLANDIGRLPVVSREDGRTLVGYVDRSCLMAARERLYEEEHVRERTWPLPRPVRRIVRRLRRGLVVLPRRRDGRPARR